MLELAVTGASRCYVCSMSDRAFRYTLRSAFALSLAAPVVAVAACGTDALSEVVGAQTPGAERDANVDAGPVGVFDAEPGALDCEALTRYGSPSGYWDGGIFENRTWEAGLYEAGTNERRSVCGCAVLPSSVGCLEYVQFPCDEASPTEPPSAELCAKHCRPVDDGGFALRSCRVTGDGQGDAGWGMVDPDAIVGAPVLECSYVQTDRCGCGVSEAPEPVPCKTTLHTFPCGDVSPDDAREGGVYGDYFDDTVCKKYCAWGNGTYFTGCGTGRDRNGALMLRCDGIGCPGRRPEGLVDTGAATGSPIGAYFAEASRMEAASVAAFEALRDEVEVHRGGEGLVRRAERARADEIRHARMTRRLALRFGAEPGDWQRTPEVNRPTKRDPEAMALENAVEGCVNETYAALLAMWQAEHARPESIRRAMRTIAEDETRHAALASDVARWLEPTLEPAARRRVDEAVQRAVRVLQQAALPTTGALQDAGILPGPHEHARLVRALVMTLEATREGFAAAA